jgi:GNAT superfamily N-acetyltransferase
MVAAYEVRALPTPPTMNEIDRYIALRLLSLQTDPSSFESTYEREIAFTDDQWRQRLDAHNKVTFVSSVADSDQKSWVATMSILTPSEITFDALAPVRDIVGKDSYIYMLVGMWVRPEHRRRGLGERLIKQGFEWIRKDNMKDSKADKLLALQVTEDNDGGWALYGKMGFELLSKVEGKNKWMSSYVG